MTPSHQTLADPLRAEEFLQPVASSELDLFAFVLLLLRNLPLILGFGALGLVLAFAYVMHLKPRFASTATILVPQGQRTAANIQARLSLSSLDLLGSEYKIYEDILNSHAVEDRLIQSHNLKAVYGVDRLEDAENILGSLTRVIALREGLVLVTVQDKDPKLAADLANDYLRELDRLNSELVLNTVGEERVYLEKSMLQEKEALDNAENLLKQGQEKMSGLPPDTQATSGHYALESARAQLRADQIRLAALLTGETAANPEVIRLRSEISELTGQVESLQRGSDTLLNGMSMAQVPGQSLEYAHRLRDVKFHESLFDLLQKQYLEAKDAEAKNPSIVQTLDVARPSSRKIWPSIPYYCALGLMLGVLAGVFLVSVRSFLGSFVRNPANAANVEEFQAVLRAFKLSRR